MVIEYIINLQVLHASPLTPTSHEHPYGSGRQKSFSWHLSSGSVSCVHRNSQFSPNLLPPRDLQTYRQNVAL